MPAVPDHVHEAVQQSLTALERTNDVSIAFAVARGSHAWGAASPASDYDVGFVFAHTDYRCYAHLGEPRTVLEWSTDDHDLGADVAGDVDLECHGWDVTHFVRLLADSNQGAIDLLRSPIRYRVAFDPDPVSGDIERTYNPIELYHDWRSIATSNYRKYLSHHLVRNDDELFPIRESSDDVYVVDTDDGTRRIEAGDERFTETKTKRTVKRNLTVIRAAMYARYLVATGERGDHDLPALAFERFLDEQAPAVFDEDQIDRARGLLERKRHGEGSAIVGDVVGREFARPPLEVEPAVHATDGPDHDRLNEFVDELLAAVVKRADSECRSEDADRADRV